MIPPRSWFVIFLVSIITSLGLLVWGVLWTPERVSGNYAVLVFDESAPDREITERLESRGFTGLVSESGQRVLLDVFDNLESIPLDEYDTRLLSFDPRNDGYAQKVRSLFVRDGKRYIYFPSDRISPETNKILAGAIEDFPYSVEVGKIKQSASSLFLLFGAVILVFFAIRPLRSALSPDAACLIPSLPALAPLALGGTPGFAMAALLAGFAVLLAQRAREKRSLLIFRASSATMFVFWLLPSSLLVCCGLLAFFSGLSPVFSLPPLCLFFVVFFCSMRFASPGKFSFSGRPANRRDLSHHRYIPIQIINKGKTDFCFAWVMLPFAIAALVPALAGFALTGFGSTSLPNFPSPDTVTETDWQNHFFFQSTFSIRSLNAARADASYLSEYSFSPDGILVEVTDSTENGDIVSHIVPPFPLDSFLRSLGMTAMSSAVHGGIAAYELFYVLVPMLFIISALVYNGSRKWPVNSG